MSHPRTVSFVVPGNPQAKGDKVHGTGKIPRERDAGRKERWRERAAIVARDARGARPLFDEPVRVRMVVMVLRPKTHFVAGRQDRGLKPSAPRWPASAPDLDKLQRSIGDALQGVLWRDDSQISTWLSMRRFAEEVGIAIQVSPEAES